MEKIEQVRKQLLEKIESLQNPSDILKSSEIKDLYKMIPTLADKHRKTFGEKVNQLKNEIQSIVEQKKQEIEEREVQSLDITAPFGESTAKGVAKSSRYLCSNGI